MTRLSGMHALYGLTPFKIRETNPYKMLAVPVSHLQPSDPGLWEGYKSASHVDKFSVPAPNFDKEVYQPYQLFGREFAPGSENELVFELDDIGDPSSWVTPPAYMELSYEALENTGHCTKGWVVSASDNRCPVRYDCPHQENPESPGGCKHYRQDGKFNRLYTVNPDIETHFADSPLSDFERFGSVRYRDKPLLGLGYTDEGEFQAYINRITFSTNVPWIYRTPWLFTRDGLGFRTQNVNAVEAEFTPDVLREFVLDRLDESDRLRNWVALKYICYDADDTGDITEKNGFDAIDTLEATVEEAVRTARTNDDRPGAYDADGTDGEVEEEDTAPSTNQLVTRVQELDFHENDDAAGFAEVLLMHSFAHLLRDRICIEYGADSEQIGYYLEHPRVASKTVQSNKVRIVMHESAIGGFGYLEEFRDTFNREGMVLNEFLEPIAEFLTEHAAESREAYEEVFDFLEKFDDPIQEDATAAFQALEELDLYPSFRAVRKVLDDEHDLSAQGETHRAQFQRLGETAPQCWDGCGLCIEDDDDCSYLPFDRTFLLSRSLMNASLEWLIEGALTPSITGTHRSLYGAIDGFIESARSELIIATPYLSFEMAQKIADWTSEWDISIRIILDDSMDDGGTRSPYIDLEAPHLQFRYDEVTRTQISVDGVSTLTGTFEMQEEELMVTGSGETVEFSFDPQRAGDHHRNLLTRWEELG